MLRIRLFSVPSLLGYFSNRAFDDFDIRKVSSLKNNIVFGTPKVITARSTSFDFKTVIGF